jgi:hypothetical protein
MHSSRASRLVAANAALLSASRARPALPPRRPRPDDRQAVAVAAQVTAGIGLWRMGYPRCNTEIIAELAATQILPILQTHAGSPERGGYRDIVPLLQKFGRFGGL